MFDKRGGIACSLLRRYSRPNMSRSLSNWLHCSRSPRAGLLRWVATVAFVIIMATSGLRHVYAHEHNQADGSVSTSTGMIPMVTHMQQDAHDRTTPDQGFHFHDTGALAHSPAAVGPIIRNISPVTQRTVFADPADPRSPVLLERFLRPPAAR